tara:strand:+ start:781 stop:1401 length:621 start_codon:yes stop_codon:yes gene_type:complete
MNLDTSVCMNIDTDLKYYDTYYNKLNCNKIIVYNNHIYFKSVIDNETINKLIEFIDIIKKYYKSIYIHITSKGGILYSLLEFIDYKKNNDLELISIIENECNDVGILLAALCNYRIIDKKAICKLSQYKYNYKYNSNSEYLYYWNYFKQCENHSENIVKFYNDLQNIFCNLIDSKMNYEKLENYLENNCVWCAKKYKKIGLADEII